jgi:CRP/FNR family transcriptional regulator, cyclic AMP receptor protein
MKFRFNVLCLQAVVMKDAMPASLENPFFTGLTAEQLDLIVPLFAPFSAAAGAVIFKQGDAATYLYLIQTGSVTIQYKPYDGPIITLDHLQSGQIFGWSSVVNGQTYTSDAISCSSLEALRLRGSALVRLCRDHPQAGSAILDRLAQVVAPRWTYARQQIQAILESSTQSQDSHAAR